MQRAESRSLILKALGVRSALLRFLTDLEVRQPIKRLLCSYLLTPSLVDPKAANENILYARAENSEDQHDQLCGLAEPFASGQYRLLIIDSIMTHFRNDYHGRGELNERQGKLNQHLRKLTQMAEEFNIAVLIINQVQSDPGASAIFAGVDGRKPIGGHVLAHASTTRILLRKGRGEERVAKVIDSPGKAIPNPYESAITNYHGRLS